MQPAFAVVDLDRNAGLFGDVVEGAGELLIHRRANLLGHIAPVTSSIQIVGEPFVNAQLALDSVGSDSAYLYVVTFRLEVFDDIGSGHGGVQNQVLALAHCVLSKLLGPAAGIAVCFPRPGVWLLAAQVACVGMSAAQIVRIDNDRISVHL